MDSLNPIPPPPATHRKRWRFQFSLRTLLILSLAAGSALLLWRNWAPWAKVQEWKNPDTAYRFFGDFIGDHGSVALLGSDYQNFVYLPGFKRKIELKPKLLHHFMWAVLSKDGTRLVAHTDYRQFHYWNAVTGDEIPLSRSENSAGDSVEFATDCFFSPDGNTVLTTNTNGMIRLWRADDGKLLKEIQDHKGITRAYWSRETNSLALTHNDGMLTSVDLTTGAMRFKSAPLSGLHAERILVDAASHRMISDERPDPNTVTSPPHKENTTRLWNYDTGAEIKRIDQKALGIWQAHRSLVTCDGQRYYEWSLEDGRQLNDYSFAMAYSFDNVAVVFKYGFVPPNSDLRCSPNGDRIARLLAGEALVYLSDDAHSSMVLPIASVRQLEFLDNTHLVTTDHDGIVVWELRRPESNSGIVTLFEFWLALLGVGALLWSVYRDFKPRSTAAPAPAASPPQ